MDRKLHDQNLPLAPSGATPIVDPTSVDHAPISVALPGVHLAGSDRSYDAHIEVGRHGFSLFLSPTAEYPTLDIDGDRKSTRLNSSHGYISYAVFCLKKN